ncbi:Carbamoyltransferase HypF [uncultured Desulfobacterium sp.]|uniref:Carbamoyltransferase n=1 Tax=uncultured Desulfobacterium sp. TaxID=201089 RepID=A0A445MUJ1_9BACT|nr:Carbamoyltransferase HypF [uncultured Desulfobacterium sp.]
MEGDYIARRLEISGIVQGVGFRPFVYRLAAETGIKGEVANTSSGVSVIIEGGRCEIDSFCSSILHGPPLAQITGMSIHNETVKGYDSFCIAGSRKNSDRSTLISPDISVCGDCIREMSNPDDRRHNYPFINCTNCGPRYSIIADLPYDRPNTSMKGFRMCNECQKEFDDPANRRFHAQPNACPRCGPGIKLYDNNSEVPGDAIEAAASLLKKGHIIALKGIGGFHLAVDAENSRAVMLLRQRKHREERPFALMSYSLKDIQRFAFATPEGEALLKSAQRPVVILEKRNPNSIAQGVSPSNNTLGVMLPYTPLHYLLLRHGFTALVMTSANISNEPIVISNEEAFKRLAGIADYFLVHDRDIYNRSDDSVIRPVAGAARFIRRSRGYVPTPVFLRQDVPRMLACGAELKNTFCLTKGNKAFLSQHIGDLENAPTYDFFTSSIEQMKKLLDITPDIIVCDQHPNYLSSTYAQSQQGIRKVHVQHHHAHIVSCMAENTLEGKIIGLAFDGLGYGTDGAMWGGEVLIADERSFIRKAHLAYAPMPGGAVAIREPWRMAISYLYRTFGRDLFGLDLPLLKEIDEKRLNIIIQTITNKVNTPNTSSLGRLFDGIAAIIGLRNTVSYEGQAAMELETICKDTRESYDYKWSNGETFNVLLEPIISGVVQDVTKGADPSIISRKFHNTLITLFTEICEEVRTETGLNRVAMSGGVFQNAIILKGLIQALSEKGFHVFTHRLVPTNDGGICLGQAVIAAQMHWDR